MNDMRIYQSEAGYNGQKMVTGTSGTGTVSRTINVQVYGGFGDGYNEIMANEWGVYQNKPSRYSAPITASELKNALCAKNYEVGSVFSESYSQISDLVKDTTVLQDNQTSVYNIHTEVEGTAHVGARVQKSARAVPIYSMAAPIPGTPT